MKCASLAYLQGVIPRARTQRDAVCADTKARDAVLVASENAHTFTLERVPDIACPIVVAAEQDATRDGECD